ncbi:hypothetical protein [Nocardioides sp. GY 10127]|uniref:hypothetical protein n=1 Tax=Nocardioides sp. GY 10127 TaxID=2569762 RepID=UPI0010A8F5F7|nr:hypothetical protein [Nocardioides sp. GY 10127]TIC82952.1 hypothetical protein E8D37_09930 [Nocardioides sp. GY 10127]
MPRFKPSEEHPVLVGLVALVGVAMAVGLLLGGIALAGTKIAGLGDDSSTSSADSTQETLYAPRPSKTSSSASESSSDSSSTASSPTSSATAQQTKKASTKKITLQASPSSVSAMEEIDLTGTYKGGEGSVLQVQRYSDGSWTDFPVTAVVSGGTFATYVQTGYTGKVKFRVVDTDSSRTSNVVSVTVG